MNSCKNVLVLGGGGYIGTVLCHTLLRNGYGVRCLDTLFFGKEKLDTLVNESGFELFVEDTRIISKSYFAEIDAVVDVSGISNDPSCDLDTELTKAINQTAALRAAAIAKECGVKRYVYASTAAVCGNSNGVTLTESMPCQPLTCYAKSKLWAEQMLLSLESEDFEPVIFRIATVFGLSPRMRFDLVVNAMVRDAWINNVVNLTGNGLQWRPFVHVTDVARALIMGLEYPAKVTRGEVFFVGCEIMNHQVHHIANLVANLIPGTELHYTGIANDQRSYKVSGSKIESKMGFIPLVTLEAGILEIINALGKGRLNAADPTCNTFHWYKMLLQHNFIDSVPTGICVTC